MINDIEQLFICLLVTDMYVLFGKCLFRSFAHFLIRFLGGGGQGGVVEFFINFGY